MARKSLAETVIIVDWEINNVDLSCRLLTDKFIKGKQDTVDHLEFICIDDKQQAHRSSKMQTFVISKEAVRELI